MGIRIIILPGLAILAIALTEGCAPKNTVVSTTTEGGKPVYPTIKLTDLKVSSGDRSMTARWKQQGAGTISGYNIYISPSTTEAVSPHNSLAYPGDTNPDDEFIEYIAEGLDNGVLYSVSVAAVFPDQTVGERLLPVRAVCGPRGECTLAVRYKSENDGFAFIKGKSVRADDTANDLYLFTKDGLDYLGSPSRLNGYLRKSRFEVVSKTGSLEQVCQALADRKSVTPGEDKIAVSAGNWVLMKSEEGFSTLIHVLDLNGKGDSRNIRFWYAVCPMKDAMVF